jgi:FAD:protein FMN transferase
VKTLTKTLSVVIEAKKRFPMFGKEVEIILYDIDEIMAVPILFDINKEGLRLQKIFNFYDTKSELSKLNNERKIKAPKELLFVIKEALKYCALTNGKYDISKGLEFWQRKNKKEIIKTTCSYKDIHISENEIELAHEDVFIDLGSIAKGYIVDKMMDYADNVGVENSYINARGDIKVKGNRIEIVAIQHPRDKNKTIHPIKLENAAIATSGDYNQFNGSFGKSHIIGQKDIISATVVSDNLMEADAFATIFCVLGKEKSESLIKKNQKIKVLLIDNKLIEHSYNGFEKLEV